ncbi:MAG: MlaD family protein [Pseudomonadota bacterium]
MVERAPAPAEEPEVERNRTISPVWLIPIVAAGLGGWLAWQGLQERGPTITIEVPTAEGLQIDKTKIRLRSVDVGVVTDLDVATDYSHVVVTAQMEKAADAYMTEGTRFWVVSPRVGLGGVSGLSTLLSGPYIAVDPGEGDATRSFRALDAPPPLTSEVPGRRFVLETEAIDNLRRGSGVYYRGIVVGQVLDYELDGENDKFRVDVFVRDPFAKFVRDDSRFWLANGVDVALQGAGLRVTVTSLEALVAGGVEFRSPPGSTSDEASGGKTFPLFASSRIAEEAEAEGGQSFLAYFAGDAGGLREGSSVLFRGLRVGEVTDVRLVYDAAANTISVPVRFRIFGGRFVDQEGENVSGTDQNLDDLVADGLRAQLRSLNLVTGELGVALDFFSDAPAATIDWSGPDPVLPTMPSSLDQLQTIVARVQSLPLAEIGDAIRQTAVSLAALLSDPALAQSVDDAAAITATLRDSVGRLEEQLTAALTDAGAAARGGNQAMAELRAVLGSTQALVDGSQGVPFDAQRLVQELRVLTRSLNSFVQYLERNPEALLRGRR